MEITELISQVKKAMSESEAYQSLPPEVRLKVEDALKTLPADKIQEFLNILERGNEKVSQLRTDLTAVENNDNTVALSEQVKETDQLLQRGQIIVTAIRSEKDQVESVSSADNLLNQL